MGQFSNPFDGVECDSVESIYLSNKKTQLPIELTASERRAAEKTLSALGLVPSLKGVERVVDAINLVRASDPVGMVRRSRAEPNKYAFAYAAGKYLLIDVNPDAPAYRGAAGDEAADIRKNWYGVYWPPESA